MDYTSPDVIKHLASFQLDSGCLVHFGVGSLTWFEGGAIVNTANETLLGDSSEVDAAVHKAAGPNLRRACEALPSRTAVRCPTGQARVTPGFKLLSKYVIHAVGPVYTSDEASAPVLAATYRSALAIAESHKRIRTVAFPAISCGDRGYPPAAAAEVALCACAAARLAEITFVHPDAAAAQPFLRAARALLSPFPALTPGASPRASPRPSPVGSPPVDAPAWARVRAALGSGRVTDGPTDSGRPTVIKHLASFQLSPTCLLHFGVGSLTWFEGDAIVNSTNSGLTTAIDGVDAAVHRAAGPGLRAACDALPAQSGVRCHPGEACLTPGFKLLAKHVIHAVGPVYASDGISAPLLASAYRSALVIANSHKRIRTVAFPAIGCGVHGYPPDAAAAVAVRACADAAGHLAEVTFVHLDPGAAQPFIRAARAALLPFPAPVSDPPPVSAPETPPAAALPHEPREALAPAWSRRTTTPRPGLAGMAKQQSLVRLTTFRDGRAAISQLGSFHLGGGCVLFLGVGDIACFAGDAVVSSTSESLDADGSLAGRLEEAAGRELREACRQLPLVRGARCPAGEARLTPGFGLPAAHIIHTVAPQYDTEATSAPVLASAYRSALTLAGDPSNGISTVAFPALGCGHRGYPLWDVAAIALDECAAYAAEAQHGLESVSFVFPDNESAQPFFFQAASMFSRMPGLASTGGAASGSSSAAGSMKQRQSLGARGEDADVTAASLETLHVHSAADSRSVRFGEGAAEPPARGDPGPSSLAAAEARHGSLFNQATQLDTFADSRAFATLPLPAPEPPEDPGENATRRQHLDFIQSQLAAFGPHGRVLKQFELLESTCRGGQAFVQFVRAPKTNAQFAMKLFASRAAYVAERSLFAIDDLRDFMPPVVEFVDNEGGEFCDPFDNPMPPCFIMERGESLRERTARCKHDFFTTIQILGQVAQCLSDLHARGWVHRDLKPGNIIFLPSRGKWTLIDFGLAARVGETPPRGHTPGYAPPEVIAAHDANADPLVADPATDAWALGVMAFELLTGQPAFDWLTGSKQAYVQLRGDALLPWEGERLTDAVRGKLGVLRKPILETLNRDPSARPPCISFCDRLRAAFSADSTSLKQK